MPLCLLRAGALYVFLRSFGGAVAQDAAGQRVVYLEVTACLPVDDDGIVAVSDLLYGVLVRALLFAQLVSNGSTSACQLLVFTYSLMCDSR